MHIDHKQLLELLAETSGIEGDKVEQQITSLIEEINQAVADGEAYEIEGFGIFSGIGNRVLFIPSKELETEINFKYAGMEPIELEADQVKEEEKPNDDPFAELQELDSDQGSKRDPFAGLVEDFNDDEDQVSGKTSDDEHLIFGVESIRTFTEEDNEEEPRPGPEEWGIEAHKEDDKGANKLLSSLMGEAYTEPKEEEPDSAFDDIFGDDVEDEPETEGAAADEAVSGLDAELSSLMSEDAPVKSAEEMEAGLLDDDLSDIFGDAEEDEEIGSEEEVFAEQIEDTENADDELEEALDELISESEDEVITEESGTPSEAEEEIESETEPDSEALSLEKVSEELDMDDFDDPFLDLEEEFSEEKEEPEKQEDIVPVITNISSGIESPKKEEPKSKKEKKQKRTKTVKDPSPAPVWLWIILALVLITGVTIGLGYFSVINIPGITPQVATVTPTVVTPPPSTPIEEETQVEQPSATQEEEVTSTPLPAPVQEQEAPLEVPVSNSTVQVPSGQNKYGLMGVVNEVANDGFTIVLFSLSVQSNALAKQQELNTAGYRTLVTPFASERYGTLWRVSIGQFATLTDAAIASENMDAKFKQSYFIKRITN